SVKFALFDQGQSPERKLSGQIECIGFAAAKFSYSDETLQTKRDQSLSAQNHREAAVFLIRWLGRQVGMDNIAAVGHRIVHGGNRFCEPTLVTTKLLKELRQLSPFDMDHLPAELMLVEAFHRRLPVVPQVACFDTAFHHDMPRVAQILPLPRRLEAKGVRRYGFHGLSYQYLLDELARVAGRKAARSRLVLAHLGNGASMAAVKNGKCMDTSMAFTPAAGLPMSTRSGDLDPGLVWFLSRTEKMSPRRFNEMVNKESGLFGISETSSDMRDLLTREATDPRAVEAVAHFCYEARKRIGSYAAALGGLDTLIFAGGIGENSPVIRQRICAHLDFLGVRLDKAKNKRGSGIISDRKSRVTVRVIPTDEEVVIARAICAFLKL
ncbi:MAG TPA: acetate/propionate family kinase, partial [Opitutales bacterium]|nr:acetate/propionate family kinase [Opitutales bacterium]